MQVFFLSLLEVRKSCHFAELIGYHKNNSLFGVVYNCHAKATLASLINEGIILHNMNLFASKMFLSRWFIGSRSIDLMLTRIILGYIFVLVVEFTWIQRIAAALSIAESLAFFHGWKCLYLICKIDPEHILLDQVSFGNRYKFFNNGTSFKQRL